jgi:hypothetical protein
MGVMSNEQTRSHGVMEGKGAYNRYAKLPAGGGALALPLLENAVRNVNGLALTILEIDLCPHPAYHTSFA